MRANQLEAAGISSLQLFAAAAPETVAAVLEEPGMNLDIANEFIK
jgi:hypothetical protein